VITSLSSHFTNANDMASNSKSATTKPKPKPRAVKKGLTDKVTKEGSGEWSGCVRWEKTNVMTGQNEDAPRGSTGEWHQRI
jgi:hypothetical protein